jgi:hypothetical protein
MSEQLAHQYHEDQSHYEISLTAGQAFVAFVLLLLSLAASFAFGLMIGKGQADDRLVVRKEPAVINEAAAIPTASKKTDGKIVELEVAEDDFKVTETAAPAPVIVEEGTVPSTETSVAAPAAEAAAAPQNIAPVTPAPQIPHYAQLLSTSDQKTAEALAAKVIDKGFTSAYVERGSSDKGPIYRVRIKFPSEADARAAEPKLKEFAKEVWITK